MHKKLAADLTSLAHSILQMKNKDDVLALKTRAYEVYEKLSVLAYVEEYIRTTPNAEHTKEELIEILEASTSKVDQPISQGIEEEIEEVVVHTLEEQAQSEEETKEVVQADEAVEERSDKLEAVVKESVSELEEEIEEAVDEVEESVEEDIEELVNETEESLDETISELEDHVTEVAEETAEEAEKVAEELVEEVSEAIELITEDLFGTAEDVKQDKVSDLDEELKDTISVDVVADLFENTPKKSLNDKLQGDIQIGLNDRIAFVKNLFDGSQEDFNRVVSQLNTFKTEKEAKKFISKMVKPDYNWAEKEEFEERFMAIVERKFA